MIRRLPLRTRVLLALATVAVLPVIVFGLVALDRAQAGVQQATDTAVLGLARTAAADASGETTLSNVLAQRLATAAGAAVAFYSADGQLLAASEQSAPTQLQIGADPATSPRVVHQSGLTTAIVPLLSGAGAATGYLTVSESASGGIDVGALLAISLVLAVLWAVFLSYAVARSLLRPVTDLTDSLALLQAGDLSVRLPVEGDDEIGRLAQSHNRLAATLATRNRSLQSVLEAIASLTPRVSPEMLASTAEHAALEAFGFTRCTISLGDGAGSQVAVDEERIPGEAYEVTVPLQAGDDRVGWLRGTLPPTRDWSAADEDLLAIFGSQFAAAVRNAELYRETESVSELKSEFLRGVSHNLQTPLTSIAAFAEQLATETHDRRPRIIADQAERLSRLVDQLLTVSKIEAGTLKPRIDVFALGPLVQRAWESLGRAEHPFALRDEAPGWLAAADRDWVDQVVWALLDNALKYGGAGPIEVEVAVGRADDPHIVSGPCLVTTVRDQGPGIPLEDRDRIFERFARREHAVEGTGLGLSVARGLLEGMGGRLWFADDGMAFSRPEVDADGGTAANDSARAAGAAFAFSLPAERVEEG